MKFKKVITPTIMPRLFWWGTIICIIGAISFIVLGVGYIRSTGHTGLVSSGYQMVLTGLVSMVLGPIVLRVCCEFVAILFSINDKLTDIKEVLEHQQNNDNRNSS